VNDIDEKCLSEVSEVYRPFPGVRVYYRMNMYSHRAVGLKT
jgi:hypothetical protein